MITNVDSEFQLSRTNDSRVIEKGRGSNFELCHAQLFVCNRGHYEVSTGSSVEAMSIMRHFGFEATFSVSLHSESLLSGQPGFDSRPAQTLRACSFAALWSERTYSTSFERSKPYLLGYVEKKRFAVLLN